jgi:SNF2 family DNA or RNA helicase
LTYNKYIGNVGSTEDDCCSDVDEVIAIQLALDESAKLEQRKKLLKKGVVQQQPTIYRRDSSDEEDDEDDDRKEEARNEETIADYVVDDSDEDNDDARAAKSILATANALSRQILRTMASWTHGAIDGMIVDGAVALSTILGNQANHNNEGCDSSYDHDDDFAIIEKRNGGGRSTKENLDHSWITKETMEQILPNVKLSEYQLIGVNWIALLHGMKCKVEGTKKSTNVNGILADGMNVSTLYLALLSRNYSVSSQLPTFFIVDM